jgi:hypothetical protein
VTLFNVYVEESVPKLAANRSLPLAASVPPETLERLFERMVEAEAPSDVIEKAAAKRQALLSFDGRPLRRV